EPSWKHLVRNGGDWLPQGELHRSICVNAQSSDVCAPKCSNARMREQLPFAAAYTILPCAANRRAADQLSQLSKESNSPTCVPRVLSEDCNSRWQAITSCRTHGSLPTNARLHKEQQNVARTLSNSRSLRLRFGC